jgi:hypothetical protein
LRYGRTKRAALFVGSSLEKEEPDQNRNDSDREDGATDGETSATASFNVSPSKATVCRPAKRSQGVARLRAPGSRRFAAEPLEERLGPSGFDP